MDASTATCDVVISADDIERFGCSSMDENVRSSCKSATDQEETLEENPAAYLRCPLSIFYIHVIHSFRYSVLPL